MNTIHITTSQNIDVEYELGSLGDRIVGWIIDWLILVAYTIVIFFLIGFSNLGRFIELNPWVAVAFVLPIFLYDLLCEMLLNGQSPGKRVMNIKVISLNGLQPSFGQYLNRWLFRLIDFSFSSGLVALIMVAVTEKKQRLGDLVAGTILVKTKLRTQLHQTIYQPFSTDAYQVTYPEVINLKDHDMQLIKEVIITVSRTGNSMLALQAQQKIEQVLQIYSKETAPITFLQVILTDYNYVTAQL
jgi:uncharacterized RDD family membrane protein YckC